MLTETMAHCEPSEEILVGKELAWWISLVHVGVGQNPVPPVTLKKPVKQVVTPTEKVP